MIVVSVDVQCDRYLSAFFFNDTASTEIYTLSLHDALPIYVAEDGVTWTFEIRSDASWHDGSAVTTDDLVFSLQRVIDPPPGVSVGRAGSLDRKSTRLNSSHW